MLQCISYWNLFYELTLTDRNMQTRFYFKVVLKSQGSDIWVSSTSFQKSNIGWPQQPPTNGNQMTNTGLFLWNGSSKTQIFTDICTFSVGGCWGQLILFFWKLVDETQISKSQNFRTTFKQILVCIFLSVRVNS